MIEVEATSELSPLIQKVQNSVKSCLISSPSEILLKAKHLMIENVLEPFALTKNKV